MPRGKRNPYPEGSAEWEIERERQEVARLEREANPPTTRNITVTVSIDAVQAAKAIGTLSGMHYKAVLATAAQNGVDALVLQVQKRLTSDPLADVAL